MTTSRIALRRCLLAAAFLMMAVIFFFSAQTGEESSQVSGGVTAFILKITVPGYAQMTEAEQLPYLEKAGHIVRKLAHFSEFALLSMLLTGYFYLRRSDGRPLPALPLGWGAATLYACTDELHQMFVADRGPSVVDVCIDSSGALFGAALVVGVIALRCRRRR